MSVHRFQPFSKPPDRLKIRFHSASLGFAYKAEHVSKTPSAARSELFEILAEFKDVGTFKPD